MMTQGTKYFVPLTGFNTTSRKSEQVYVFFNTSDLETAKDLTKCFAGDAGLDYLMTFNSETQEIDKAV